jgi:uncharacterized protein YjbI with pentapeptide repeats
MNTRKVLRRYADGERNFCKADLRGQDFTNCDLSDADFSHAKIQGANFTHANLQRSKFAEIKAGQPFLWQLILAVTLVAIASFSGFFSAYAILAAASNLGASYIQKITIFPGLIALSMAIIYVAIRLNQKKGTFTSIPGSVRRILILISEGIGAVIGAVAAISALVSFNFVIIFIGAFIVGSITIALALTLQLTMIPIRIMFGRKLSLIVPFLLILGSIFGSLYQQGSFSSVALTVGLVTSAMLVEALWTTHRVISEDPDLALTRTVSIAIASICGTNFQGANLTDAIFTKAQLKSCNFIKANLTGVAWQGAKQLNYARLEKSYLASYQIRTLVVTSQGAAGNFDGLDLQGINLQGVNLQDTSFIRANLNDANLQDANLSMAILKQTQLDGADLTGVLLTGACIEDWGITGSTKLNGIRCEYVFMRYSVGKTNPLRKPDNEQEIFDDGGFANFIQPYVDTLDLYHSQKFDPRAVSVAFNQISDKYPEADLEIVAIEKRGQNGLNLKVKTSADADKSKLSADYIQFYNWFRGLPASTRWNIAQETLGIRNLTGILQTVQQNLKVENLNMSSTINQYGSGDNIAGDKVMGDKIDTQINNSQDLSQAAKDIKTLLDQLSIDYPSDSPRILGAKAVDQVEKNPELRSRIIRGVKAGGFAALEKMVDHPVAKFFIEGAKEVLKP